MTTSFVWNIELKIVGGQVGSNGARWAPIIIYNGGQIKGNELTI